MGEREGEVDCSRMCTWRCSSSQNRLTKLNEAHPGRASQFRCKSLSKEALHPVDLCKILKQHGGFLLIRCIGHFQCSVYSVYRIYSEHSACSMCGEYYIRGMHRMRSSGYIRAAAVKAAHSTGPTVLR